jgi:hypothetical protein
MKRLTSRQIDIKARKYRLIAGALHVDSRNEKLPAHVRMSLARAHDVLWAAIREIENLPAREAAQ